MMHGQYGTEWHGVIDTKGCHSDMLDALSPASMINKNKWKISGESLSLLKKACWVLFSSSLEAFYDELGSNGGFGL